MKIFYLQKHLFFTLFFWVFLCSVSSANPISNSSSNKQDSLAKDVIQSTAAVIGVAGGLVGLYKYLSEKREKELREWQKVIIYRIFRQDELSSLTFSRILEKYRIEAQAIRDFDLNKKEISEDALRRVLLELSSSGILNLVPSDSFKLKVEVPKLDVTERFEQFNSELFNLIGSSPFVYTLEDVANRLADKIGIAPLRLQADMNNFVGQGQLVMNEDRRIAFPWQLSPIK
jgi:hypothetical protein